MTDRDWRPGSQTVESLALVVVVTVAAWSAASAAWVIPIALAAPLFAVELGFDVRSRGRRLVPELCGAIGIGAIAAAIVLADDRPRALAAGLWLVLAARSVGSISFVRAQINRLHARPVSIAPVDGAQLLGTVFGVLAVAIDRRLAAGLVGLTVLGAAHAWSIRRPPVPAKTVGFGQMGIGLALVMLTAAGVLLS